MSKIEKKRLWDEIEVAAIINAAIAAEREACAVVADPGPRDTPLRKKLRARIAAAIRARAA